MFYMVTFFIVAERIGKWRLNYMTRALEELPEQTRRRMVEEPWLSVPPPTYDTPMDDAYRQSYRKSKWPERVAWLAFFALWPAINWLLGRM